MRHRGQSVICSLALLLRHGVVPRTCEAREGNSTSHADDGAVSFLVAYLHAGMRRLTGLHFSYSYEAFLPFADVCYTPGGKTMISGKALALLYCVRRALFRAC